MLSRTMEEQSQIVLSVWKLFPLEQPSAKILGKFIK